MIQSGTIEFPATGLIGGTTGAWPLDNGQGDRTFRTQDIPFPIQFAQAPHVSLSIAGIDADGQTNLRVRLVAEDVQQDEFNIRVSTWADTLIYSLVIAWVAHDGT
jgi:hypothetical protein